MKVYYDPGRELSGRGFLLLFGSEADRIDDMNKYAQIPQAELDLHQHTRDQARVLLRTARLCAKHI